MKLGILGGTFDPPHVGHLLAASDAMEQLALDRLIFIPNARQPLKDGGPEASGEERVTMLQLATSNEPRFEVDPIEVERGGVSFTVDTLESFAARYPDDEVTLLLGVDAALTLPNWKSPQRIGALATIAVLRRGNEEPVIGEGDLIRSIDVAMNASPGRGARLLNTRRVDVSSTEIRERCRTGRSIQFHVHDAVARFIAERGLYRRDLNA